MASQQRYGSMVVRHCKLCCWRLETFPQDLRDAAIITMYKNKMSDCSNYRGITFLSITSKILPRVLLNRPVPTIAEQHLPEIQCGFRANRRTTDMVFVLMQIQQKCRRQNKGLQITSVDLTKAFETVCRKGLWKILEKLGRPPKFLTMVIKLQDSLVELNIATISHRPSQSQMAWNRAALLLYRCSQYFHHDAPAGLWEPQWRWWRIHTFLYRWQLVQPEASGGVHKDHGASDQGVTICWRQYLCYLTQSQPCSD